MPTVLPLTSTDTAVVDDLWARAQACRRQGLGLGPASVAGGLLDRPGAFGVGLIGDRGLVACALGAPAREDDGHSSRPVAGLVHVYGVATCPGLWGRGFGGQVVRGVLSQADRRGFSRAQLWTYDTGAAAARCYTRAGFTPTGRRAVNDQGEAEAHWMTDVVHPVVGRRAARMLCLDRHGRVLLQRYRDPVDGFEFWEPPGGGIEPGETPEQAMWREWREETRLPAPTLLAGPVDVGRDELWKGARGVVTEQFFLGRLDADAPVVPPAVADATDMGDYLGHAWVAHGDLVRDTFEGARCLPDVAPVMGRLNVGG